MQLLYIATSIYTYMIISYRGYAVVCLAIYCDVDSYCMEQNFDGGNIDEFDNIFSNSSKSYHLKFYSNSCLHVRLIKTHDSESRGQEEA